MEMVKTNVKAKSNKPLQELIDDLSASIGKDKVSDDKPTRLVYRITHGPEALLHESLDNFLPAVVVRPDSTEDIQKIVRLANHHEIPIVPQGGRTCSYGAEAMRDCIVIDTASMDRILGIDEGSYRITAEAGVRVSDFIDYLSEKGYLSLEYPTMNRASTLGARAALHGYNKFENRWGSSASNIKGLEVVLPNGEAVKLGRGTSRPTKSVVGLNLMDLFIGSRGTLGVITKVTERFIDMPPEHIRGALAFQDYKDGLKAYITLKKPLNSGLLWRIKTYHKWFLTQAVEGMMGMTWPDDVDFLVDYHILGKTDLVELMDKHVVKLMKDHNGFWRSDMPPIDFLGNLHETVEKYMGMGSLSSDRVKMGGMANRIIFLDPIVADGKLIEYFTEFLKLADKVVDGESYPALAENMKVLSPGAPVPGEVGFTKVSILLLANWKKWDEETRTEFKNWFRMHAELVLRFDGTITGTHGFIPRDMEIEFVRREITEKTYEFMKKIKRTIDPKNIMNPKVRF
jgi:FAD/FMN-containing dehydrogenase